MSTLDRLVYVHEWLTEWGGSEDVLRAMLQSVPSSGLYATIDFLSDAHRARLGGLRARTTFLQRFPFVREHFWKYLPITPLAVESLDLSEAQVIVSGSHAFAKGVLTTANQLHLSYVHSPMRWAWDLHHEYLRDYRLDRGFKSVLARYLFHRLRQWDRQTANNVDLFLANSHHVRQRIWRTYRRPARVLYPPVRTARFQLQTTREDHYVTVSRLVSYKRVDLIVEAFRNLPNKKLVVIGDGPELPRLRANCPPNVELMGFQSDEVVQRTMGSARAFVFAAHEDFGISPVEAQACGTPVIAYGVGGATETVRDLRSQPQPTGLLFPQQTPASLVEAIEAFEASSSRIDPHDCHAWAQRFGEERFTEAFSAIVAQAWDVWQRTPRDVEARLIEP